MFCYLLIIIVLIFIFYNYSHNNKIKIEYQPKKAFSKINAARLGSSRVEAYILQSQSSQEPQQEKFQI